MSSSLMVTPSGPILPLLDRKIHRDPKKHGGGRRDFSLCSQHFETNTSSARPSPPLTLMSFFSGQRISLGPHRGTVRYHGPVPPSTGEWLGIEWDDPSRGKHDGTSSDGTRFFTVRVPGSGSFIRPTSSKLSSGCSFIAALRNKYSSEEAQVKSAERQEYSRKTIADIEIETPNLDRIARKAARLDRLKEVGLGGWHPNDADADHDGMCLVAKAFDAEYPAGSIRETCPNIRWLDLSRSLLPDWEEISLVAGDVVQLKTLLLHFNRLQTPPPEVPESWRSRLGRIEDLRLDGTFMQWDEVLRLAPALEGLQHLQLGSNNIASLSTSCVGASEVAVFPNLASLTLEDNVLSSWEDIVRALSSLPALETLNLNRNSLTSIPPPTTSSHKLSQLKELHLRGNRIQSWSSLEHIPQWIGHRRGLEALQISTVLDEGEAEPSDSGLLSNYEYRDFRAITIARLSSLTVLDKTEITPKERKDAELFVFSRFRDGDASIIEGSRTGEKLMLSSEEKAARFPRYFELAKRFDADLTVQEVQPENKTKSSNTLRSRMLSLRLIATDTAPSSDPPHIVGAPKAEAKVQILASTPLRLAKIKLASAGGLKPTDIARIYALLKSSTDESIVLELDDPSRNLDYYEVSSSDTIILVTHP